MVGYIPGDINTSVGLTKSLSSVNLRSLLSGHTFRIVTEWGKKEIRRKIPSKKRYIVYPETTRGGVGGWGGDLDTEMRRRTRVGRCGKMALGWKSPPNSFSRLYKWKFAKRIKITKNRRYSPKLFRKEPDY